MANKGVVVVNKAASEDIDAFNRSVSIAQEVENGMVFSLMTGYSSVAGEGEVFAGAVPATGAGLTNLWMAYEAVVNTADINGKLVRGITVDPRDFSIASGKVFSAFKLQLGDIITMSEDAVAGTKSTNGFVVATNAADQLTWAAAAVSGVSLKLLETTYIPLADGSIGKQRLTAYRFEVVALA